MDVVWGGREHQAVGHGAWQHDSRFQIQTTARFHWKLCIAIAGVPGIAYGGANGSQTRQMPKAQGGDNCQVPFGPHSFVGTKALKDVCL